MGSPASCARQGGPRSPNPPSSSSIACTAAAWDASSASGWPRQRVSASASLSLRGAGIEHTDARPDRVAVTACTDRAARRSRHHRVRTKRTSPQPIPAPASCTPTTEAATSPATPATMINYLLRLPATAPWSSYTAHSPAGPSTKPPAAVYKSNPLKIPVRLGPQRISFFDAPAKRRPRPLGPQLRLGGPQPCSKSAPKSSPASSDTRSE